MNADSETAIAKRLPYADHIVCLGAKGEITARGSFAELNDAGGYVSSFSLPRADWTRPASGGGVASGSGSGSSGSSSGSGDSDDSGRVVDEIAPSEIGDDHKGVVTASADVVRRKGINCDHSMSSSETVYTHNGGDPDTSRQTGDVKIYLYYVKSVGWVASLIFVAAIIGFVFCTSFPSKYSQLPPHSPQSSDWCRLTDLCFLQPSGCSGGLSRMSRAPTNGWDTGWACTRCSVPPLSSACLSAAGKHLLRSSNNTHHASEMGQ